MLARVFIALALRNSAIACYRGGEYTKPRQRSNSEGGRDIASFDLAVPGALWYHVVDFSSMRRRPLFIAYASDAREIPQDTHGLWHIF
jgi:hypothetical protein